MKNYKRKVIIWSILSVVAFIGIILLSYLVNLSQSTLDSTANVNLDEQILSIYRFVKAYAIGGLAFCCILLVIGSIITYAGIRSWKYAEMF
ncbi:hypothetical protein [Mycoplasmopsis columboralis]|uniref:Uncharacterized protein n=1 Tax=Mycoplasmopsis columboralis TaxID=171282 RepID=A0A449B7E7_9BACT|nr:hypothetical protein [Mycoplasmopsis columboralis]VEU76513.1 Uncharacterised protein [Mycoplasmopsis columboralis]